MKEILRSEHIREFYGNQGSFTKAVSDLRFLVLWELTILEGGSGDVC